MTFHLFIAREIEHLQACVLIHINRYVCSVSKVDINTTLYRPMIKLQDSIPSLFIAACTSSRLLYLSAIISLCSVILNDLLFDFPVPQNHHKVTQNTANTISSSIIVWNEHDQTLRRENLYMFEYRVEIILHHRLIRREYR